MLTKAVIKYVKSLKDKKNRDSSGTFVVEGNKMVAELVNIFKCQYLIATNNIIKSIENNTIDNIIEVNNNDIERISFLKNPQESIAVFYKPKYTDNIGIKDKLTLVLDEIQDPGNLGTIIRIADWYGIEDIVCSKNTADVYNPKTVQATMGALARVRIHYVDLIPFLKSNSSLPIYGTFLDGENIYSEKITSNGIIIMGNEGNGVSKEVENYVNKRLFIPSYPPNQETSESLNVAVATAIVCAEFRRQAFSLQ